MATWTDAIKNSFHADHGLLAAYKIGSFKASIVLVTICFKHFLVMHLIYNSTNFYSTFIYKNITSLLSHVSSVFIFLYFESVSFIMEYTVGSLAGLISGKSPKNKQKIVAKEFQMPAAPEESPQKIQSPKKKKKDRKSESEVQADQTVTSTKQKKEKSPKKRKSEPAQPDLLDSDSEQQPPNAKNPKLSENDENAIKRIKKKKRIEKQESVQYNDRTIFVGNVPISTKKIKLKKHFRQYGLIEAVRIRGIPVKDPKTPKKVAAIKKEYHPERNTVFAYIRFVEAESVKKAEAENGAVFEDHHLIVQSCQSRDKHDESKAIFIGNMPFDAEEEDVWQLFQDCGDIASIRIVRDGRTGMGKGFGYVNFKDPDSVQLAMELENVKLKNRELRISMCDIKRSKKKNGIKKPRHRKNKHKAEQGENNDKNEDQKDENSFQKDRKQGPKKFAVKTKVTENGGGNQLSTPKQHFGGTKFDEKKKKKKFSKDLAQKKKLAKKLTPKPAA